MRDLCRRMGVRERVHRAIESSAADTARTLREAEHASDAERLTFVVDGWFRGIAGALEELAVELDLLRDAPGSDGDPAPQAAAPRAHGPDARPATRSAADADDGSLDEASLAERARASREATEAIRAETRSRTDDETTEREE